MFHSLTAGYEISFKQISLKNTLYQVELKLVKWFWRRRFKCEMFMSMLMSPTDKFQKSSLKPSVQVSEKYITRLFILSVLTFLICTCVIWIFFFSIAFWPMILVYRKVFLHIHVQYICLSNVLIIHYSEGIDNPVPLTQQQHRKWWYL